MRKRGLAVSGFCLALGLMATIGVAAVSDEAKPYLGEWGVTLQNTGTSFNACWIDVFEKGDGLDMRMLWRYGSVTPVKSVAVRDGQLLWVRPEYSETAKGNVDTTYTAKVEGDKLSGSVKMPDGAAHNFTGTREFDVIDVAGTWVSTEAGQQDNRLVLKQDGNTVTGNYMSGSETAPIENAKLVDNKLTFEIAAGDARVKAEGVVEGDRIKGAWAQGGEQGAFEGKRLRKQGEKIMLYTGKDFAGWKPREGTDVLWDIDAEDWASPRIPGGQDITSERAFGDHTIHVDYMFPKTEKEEYYNSGVYARGRYEVQLLGDFGKGISEHGTGAIYSRIPPSANVSKPLGEPQSIDITLVGKYITVVVNGTTVVDNAYLEGITGGAIDVNENDPGPVMLQAHGQKVKFKNVYVVPLEKE